MRKRILAIIATLMLGTSLLGCGGTEGFDATENISIIT